MPEVRQFPIWIRTILPLLVAVGIGLSAQPARISDTYQALNRAGEHAEPGMEAAYLAKLAAWFPWQMDLMEAAGYKAFQAGNLEKAILYFKNAESLGTLSKNGYLSLADAFIMSGQEEKALAVWEGLIEQDQAPASVLEKVTRHYWRTGRIEQALISGKKWREMDPDNSQAHLLYGLLLIVQSPSQAAGPLIQAKTLSLALAAQVDALLKALKEGQNEQHAGYQKVLIGRALGSLGYWDLAEKAFAEGTRLNPDYAEAWAFLGEARQQLGADGYPALMKALELDPGSVVTRALAALYYRRQGKPEASLVLLEEVARSEPRQAMWQVELGNTMLELKNISAAVAYYQQAAQIDPTDVRYWVLLAEFCAEQQASLRDIGLPSARQALTLSPDNPEALDAMGQIMQRLEDSISAERFFQLALEKDSGFSDAHLHLGQLYLQDDRMQEARFHLLQAHQLSSETSEVRLMAHRLLERYFGNE